MAQFRFNQPPVQDAGKTFQGISRFIQGAGKALRTIEDQAREEELVEQQFQSELDSLLGLVDSGGLSEEQYSKIVRDQNAAAQKDGIIRAHENFSLLQEIDKERASIRLSAYTEKMKNMVPMLSQVGPDGNELSFEEAERDVFTQLSQPSEPTNRMEQAQRMLFPDSVSPQSLGKDSTGADVFMNLDTMTTGELIAFSKAKAANDLALRSAVNDNKHDIAVQAATNHYQIKVSNILSTTDISTSAGVFQLQERLSDAALEAFGFGVQEINTLTVQGIESFATEWATTAPITPSLQSEIYNSIDAFQGIELREGAGNFSESGTENFNKMQAIKEGVSRDIAQRLSQESAARAARDNQVEQDLKLFVLDEINKEITMQLEQGGGQDTEADVRFSVDFERTLSVQLIQRAAELGHTDPDKVLGSFDTLIENLSFESHERYLGHSLHNIEFVADSEEELRKQEDEAYTLFTRGTISLSDYKSISKSVKSRIDDLKSGATVTTAALKEGGFGSTAMRTTITKSAEDILKMNDTVKVINSFTGEKVTIRGEDNDQISTNKLKVEQRYILDRERALNGETLVPVEGIVPFTEEEIFQLKNLRQVAGKSVGIDNATLESIGTLFETIPMVDPGEDISKIRNNVSIINQRAIAYAQYLAMQRLLHYGEEEVKAVQETESESFSGSNGIKTDRTERGFFPR